MPKALNWRTSSYSPSGSDPDCVEVAFGSTFVAVRDSKNRDAGHLSVPPANWAALLAVVTSTE